MKQCARPSVDGLSLFNEFQSINQSCIFRLVQVIKSLQDQLAVGNNLIGINNNVTDEAWNRNVFRC